MGNRLKLLHCEIQSAYCESMKKYSRILEKYIKTYYPIVWNEEQNILKQKLLFKEYHNKIQNMKRQ